MKKPVWRKRKKRDIFNEFGEIKEYLKQHENKELCRFITCGSVDDGKSTLIGRMLYDSKSLFEDQIKTLKKDSQKNKNLGGGGSN